MDLINEWTGEKTGYKSPSWFERLDFSRVKMRTKDVKPGGRIYKGGNMRLRNKKTGGIISAESTDGVDGVWLYDQTNHTTIRYNSLAELNAEWEDVPEEPFSTTFYTIVDGEIKHCIFYRERVAGCPSDAWAYLKDDGRERIKQLKEVGLYFSTREEAEKAVEKLKAWKRLKDKGFKIALRGWKGNAWLYANWGKLQDDYSDVLLLFGGEE